MVKALAEMGYKTQVQPLSHFHDDYGLEGPDDGGEEEEDEFTDEEGASSAEGSSGDEEMEG